MGVLTDEEIKDYIINKNLIKDYKENLIQSCSYDMRVGTIFRDGQIINVTHPRSREQIIVMPGEVMTMLTLESLEMPSNLLGTVYAMNRMSLNGFLVLNPGHIDPGHIGALSIKAINLRKSPLCISVGEPIFTIVFQRLQKDVLKPYSKNIDRSDRELEINKKEVESSMKSISDLMQITHEDINKLIEKHWTTRFYNFLAISAALFSIIAAVFTGLQFYNSPNGSKDSSLPVAPATSIKNNVPQPAERTIDKKYSSKELKKVD